jgi:hypothetical protein
MVNFILFLKRSTWERLVNSALTIQDKYLKKLKIEKELTW